MKIRSLVLSTLFIIVTITGLQAQDAVADRIVAQVNDRVILKSEIDARVADELKQARFNGERVQFSEAMWYSYLEDQINTLVLLEKARLDSVTVSDEQVNQQMDARIQQLVQQAGSERALEQAFGKSLIQLKADFRQDFREGILQQRMQQMKMQEIQITRPEVREFFETIPADSLPVIPEEVALSQIVKVPPATGNARQAALNFANQLRDSILVHGKSIEELARRHSDDPGSASRGGLLPMMGLNELVPEYSAAASALQPGGISEVVETDFGFHVIKLKNRVGDRIETNHILIEIKSDVTDEAVARKELNAIRDSILTQDVSFSEMARRHSDDPNTASSGGKLIDPRVSSRLIPVNALDPSMYQVVLRLDEVGQISEPSSFDLSGSGNRKALRIVRLDDRVPEHKANFEQDYDRIRNIALREKRFLEYNKWLMELRDEFYVEYKIPVPNKYKTGI